MLDYGAEEIQTVKQIEEEIARLEADIDELRTSMPRWHVDHANIGGSKLYRGKARRIVLQAQKIEELIKEKTFSR